MSPFPFCGVSDAGCPSAPRPALNNDCCSRTTSTREQLGEENREEEEQRQEQGRATGKQNEHIIQEASMNTIQNSQPRSLDALAGVG